MCSTNGPQCFLVLPLLYLAPLVKYNCTTLYIRADLANAVSLASFPTRRFPRVERHEDLLHRRGTVGLTERISNDCRHSPRGGLSE
jgi:hypothetical protein